MNNLKTILEPLDLISNFQKNHEKIFFDEIGFAGANEVFIIKNPSLYFIKDKAEKRRRENN